MRSTGKTSRTIAIYSVSEITGPYFSLTFSIAERNGFFTGNNPLLLMSRLNYKLSTIKKENEFTVSSERLPPPPPKRKKQTNKQKQESKLHNVTPKQFADLVQFVFCPVYFQHNGSIQEQQHSASIESPGSGVIASLYRVKFEEVRPKHPCKP